MPKTRKQESNKQKHENEMQQNTKIGITKKTKNLKLNTHKKRKWESNKTTSLKLHEQNTKHQYG